MATLTDAYRSTWLHPRLTVARLCDEPGKLPLRTLAVAGGVAVWGSTAYAAAQQQGRTGAAAAALALAGILVSALADLYAYPWLLRLVGGALGGTGDIHRLRVAVVWSKVVPITGFIICLPTLFFSALANQQGLPPSLADTLIFLSAPLSIAKVVIGLWGCCTVVFAVAEAHRFSALRSSVAVILASILISLAGLLIGVVCVLGLAFVPALALLAVSATR